MNVAENDHTSSGENTLEPKLRNWPPLSVVKKRSEEQPVLRVSTDIERRHGTRRRVVIECSWTRGARLTDLSLSGCYVDTARVPTRGEDIVFTARLDKSEVLLRGRVVHAKDNVGFAVSFADLEIDAATRLNIFLARRAHNLASDAS